MHPPCVLGHRGFPTPATPENTLGAFAAALAAGADGLEVDVRLTADGVPVCAHDDDLSRVAGVETSIARSTEAQVRAVPLPAGQRVPRLDALPPAPLVVLDVKPDPRVDELVGAVLADMPAGALVSSFDDAVLELVARVRPDVPRAAILDEPDDAGRALARAVERGDAALHLPLRTVLRGPLLVRAAVEAGVDVRVWTVDRLVDARLCAVAGVCGVITDRPDLLVAGLRPRSAASA